MSQPHHDVVAAILVRDGKVLLCHRHPNRRWFPNVWDVPGGHIESGERPADAVRRELTEELGLQIQLDGPDRFRVTQPAADVQLRTWVVTEWEGEIENRAPSEHDNIAWFTADQLADLDLADSALVELLLDALGEQPTRESESDAATRQHLTIVFAEDDLPELARLRHTWDPVMAAGVPPHLTVVYPEEVNSFAPLLRRASSGISTIPSFQIGLGAVVAADNGAGGVFVEALDPSGSIRSLRNILFADRSEPANIGPHVTIAHPRTTDQGPACWQQLEGWSAGVEVAVSEIAFTRTSVADGMKIVETFQLR